MELPAVYFVVLLIVAGARALDDGLAEIYARFRRKYGQGSVDELSVDRLDAFRKNVEHINAHNFNYDLGRSSFFMGLNAFADRTESELRSIAGGCQVPDTEADKAFFKGLTSRTLPVANATVPDSIDWRKKGIITRIKNQNMCGSCYAFAAIGGAEAHHCKKTGQLTEFSEQEIVDCARGYGNYGCLGGHMIRVFHYMQHNGIALESEYPYVGRELGYCREHRRHPSMVIRGFVRVPRSESAMKEIVGTIGPVTIGADFRPYSAMFYGGGIHDNVRQCTNDTGHALLVVGYGRAENKDFWIMKNSFGYGWGEDGYIRMVRNKHNQCGIVSYSSYPVF